MKTLEELDKSKFAFITFRSHDSEPQVFEDFISLLLPHISLKFLFYIYSIEDDDTSSRHIHILVKHEERDKDKLKQKIEQKWFKDFGKSLQGKQTILKHALHYGRGPDGEDFGFSMTIEDKMKCIGYICKDITRRNKRDILSQEVITQCCDFYFANRRIKNASTNDWIAITPKNIHQKIEQFQKEHELDINDPGLITFMTDSKHTFNQITKQQRKLSLAELKWQQGNKSLINKQIILEDLEEPQNGQFLSTEAYEYKCKYYEEKSKREKLEIELEELKKQLE